MASGSRVVLACQACGKDFDCKAREMKAGRRFCSKSCMLNVRRKPPRNCLGCGILFFARVHADPRKGKGQYCSKKCAGAARRDGRRTGRWAEGIERRLCRARVKPSQRMYAAMQDAMRRHIDGIQSLWQAMAEWRPCLHCGGSLNVYATERTMFCSIKCASKHEYAATCSDCGKSFAKIGKQGKACRCDECKAKRVRFWKRQSGRNIASRARKYGVARVRYRRHDIFERDGWRCQLCGELLRRKWACNKRTLAPHARNATLDHIVPMSKGGADAEWNVQACCFGCNSKKSATAKGQLRLRL